MRGQRLNSQGILQQPLGLPQGKRGSMWRGRWGLIPWAQVGFRFTYSSPRLKADWEVSRWPLVIILQPISGCLNRRKNGYNYQTEAWAYEPWLRGGSNYLFWHHEVFCFLKPWLLDRHHRPQADLWWSLWCTHCFCEKMTKLEQTTKSFWIN